MEDLSSVTILKTTWIVTCDMSHVVVFKATGILLHLSYINCNIKDTPVLLSSRKVLVLEPRVLGNYTDHRTDG